MAITLRAVSSALATSRQWSVQRLPRQVRAALSSSLQEPLSDTPYHEVQPHGNLEAGARRHRGARLGVKISDCSQDTERLFSDRLEAMKRRRMWPEMLTELEVARSKFGAKNLTLKIYNLVLDALASGRRVKECRELIEGMRSWGVAPDEYSFNALIKAYALAGGEEAGEHARRVMKDMRSAGVLPDRVSYNTLILALGGAEDWEAPLRVLEEMQEDPATKPDETSFAVAIKVCGATGRWDRALSLLEADMPAAGVAPGSACLHAAMRACVQSGRWEEALGILFEGMDAAGVRRDASSYATAITACGRGGMWETGLQVLDLLRAEISEQGSISREEGMGHSVDEEGRVGGGSGRGGKAAVASMGMGWGNREGIVRSRAPPALQLNARVFNAAMKACLDCGQHEAALGLLEQMRAEGVTPDAAAFGSALRAHVELGWWGGALDLLEHSIPMARVGPNVGHYNASLVALGRGGRWDLVPGVLQSMVQQSPRVRPNRWTYVAAIEACKHRDRDQVRFRVGGGRGSSPEQGVCTMGGERARGGAPVSASGIEPRVAGSAGGGNGDGDRDGGGYGVPKEHWQLALELLEEACSNQERVALVPAVFDGVIEACADVGKWEIALELLEEMRSGAAGGRSSGSPVGGAVGSRKINISGYKFNGRESASGAQIKPGGGSWATSRTLAGVIRALGAGGKWEEALNLLKEARWGGGVEGYSEFLEGGAWPDVSVFAAAMEACGSCGEWRSSLDLLEEMKASGAKGGVSSVGAEAGAGMGGAGEVVVAPAPKPDQQCYNVAMWACVQGEQWERVLGLLTEMDPTCPYIPKGRAGAGAGDGLAGCESSARREWEGIERVPGAVGAMIAGSGAPEPHSNAPEPDVESYNAALAALEALGHWEDCLGLLDYMAVKGDRSVGAGNAAGLTQPFTLGEGSLAGAGAGAEAGARGKSATVAPVAYSYELGGQACMKAGRFSDAGKCFSKASTCRRAEEDMRRRAAARRTIWGAQSQR